jgi:thiosulfate reductase cytochrome b subunit
MKIRKYLGPQRLIFWHSLNGIFVLTLAFTGFAIYFSDYGISFIDFDARHSIHEFAGIAAAFIYVLLFGIFHLESNKHRLNYWWQTILHALFVSKEPATKHKNHYKNIISRYQIIMFLLFPIMIISGVVLLLPEYTSKTFWGIDVYFLFLIIHIINAILLTIFLVLHVCIAFINKKDVPFLQRFFKFWYSL